MEKTSGFRDGKEEDDWIQLGSIPSPAAAAALPWLFNCNSDAWAVSWKKIIQKGPEIIQNITQGLFFSSMNLFLSCSNPINLVCPFLTRGFSAMSRWHLQNGLCLPKAARGICDAWKNYSALAEEKKIYKMLLVFSCYHSWDPIMSLWGGFMGDSPLLLRSHHSQSLSALLCSALDAQGNCHSRKAR